jgi:RNA polymerase primary sigma factor
VNPSPAGEPAPPDLRDGLAIDISRLGRQRPLTADEERRLAWAVRSGDRRAAACLVEANLDLVVSVARRYASCGVPFMDLVQEGHMGLMEAVDGYDPVRNGRFSAYASWCIRQAVRQAAVEEGRVVRIPPATARAIERLRRAFAALTEVLDREPATAELAKEMDTPPLRVSRLLRLARPLLPLDAVGGDGDGDPPHEIRTPAPRFRGDPGDGASSSDELVVAALRVDLYAMLARLTARERRVLQLRFGLVDDHRCSMDEIGRRLGLSRERVRQVERGALCKLRIATDAARLAGYLD